MQNPSKRFAKQSYKNNNGHKYHYPILKLHDMDATPAWLSQQIIYHILIDRFNGIDTTKDSKKPEFLGGNIQGIIDKIEYLKDLGITTIWISPFNKTSAYHGYHITDFYAVDPHFGTETDLKLLIHTCHHNNIKIIADFVANHCSNQHPYFLEAQSNPNSPYKDWFIFTNYPDTYQRFLSINELPKLNLHNLETQHHILNAAKKWQNLGFDGFRLDHVIGPTRTFWKQFSEELKKENPNFVLLGEAWMMGIRWNELSTINIPFKRLRWFFPRRPDKLYKDYQNILDGCLDFYVQQLLSQYGNGFLTTAWMHRHIRRHYKRFKQDYYLPSFLDNHDMDRILYQLNNNKNTLKTLAYLQFNLPQPPIIYYGTEQAMSQEKSIWDCPSHGDVLARQPMQWNTQENDLYEFYKELIRQRKDMLLEC